MIRVWLSNSQRAYGFDVTGWEKKTPNDLYYDNLLTEDLVERINEGDILMYFPDNESADEWCYSEGYEYELVKNDDN